MKKISLRPFVWGLLIVASLSSYTYLHCASNNVDMNATSLQVEQEMENAGQQTKPFMPDVALVKKILNITKIVLPKD